MGKNILKYTVSLISTILILSLLVLGLSWADSNGIWHRAEDIQPGTFGGDEDAGDYTFDDKVIFEDDIEVDTITSSNANGNIIIQLG